MTPNDFELYEKDRMSKNAWRVADIVRARVDDAPVLGDFISALLAEKMTAETSFSINLISRNIKLQPNRRNLMYLAVPTSRRF